jgi:para-nitrobenzyl esterase
VHVASAGERFVKSTSVLSLLRGSRFPFALVAVAMLSFFGATMAVWPATGLVVATNSGQLRGVHRHWGGAEFLGIPYAQPPVGALRWREPAPMAAWTGVRNAQVFGAPCAQPTLGDWNKRDAEISKEDCLYLNVITPVWPPKNPLPVMLWIHGGGNQGGTASSALYKDGTLVKHGVVLVTVNYRLGILGFLAHPELTRESAHHASGNYGLMDQVAALRWVRENIARFGGDPGNITVFGQSAGAQDTSLLMASPLSKDQFQRAIVESGSAIVPPLPALAEAEKTGQKLAALLNAPEGGAIRYLRGKTTAELVKVTANQDPGQPPLTGPDIDGWVIPRSPAEFFASGGEAAIPMIAGTTTREFGLSATPDDLRKMIASAEGDFAIPALSVYGLDNSGTGVMNAMYGSAADQWIADVSFRCPVSTQAKWHNAAHYPTYEYEFNHAIPGQEAKGAVHSADLPYVFGFFPKTGNIAGKFTALDRQIADRIETYWTNFAKTGNPNGGTLPKWAEFGASQTYVQFTQEGRVVTVPAGLRAPQCDLYREVLKQRMNPHP